jgi:hypothetical protein
VPADRLEMHDPNAAVLAILGARGYDAHRLLVPLDDLADLKFVVEPHRGAFSGAAVDVTDVIEAVCHNRFGPQWA